MATIIEKTFNATKRIVRSIFRGSPNLFTTSDINRQMEAFKYQLDQLDAKVGVLSDVTWDIEDLGEGTYRIIPSLTYLKVRGCDFTSVFPRSPFEINLVVDTVYYICLFGQTKVVTYEDDDTHDISGAKFVDGTSRPAADQLCYDDSSIYIGATTSPAAEGNLIAVLFTMKCFEGAAGFTYEVRRNTIGYEKSVLLNQGYSVDSLYDFVRLFKSTFRTILQIDPFLRKRRGDQYIKNNNVSIGVKNGFLILTVTAGEYPFYDAYSEPSDFSPLDAGKYIDIGCVVNENVKELLESFMRTSQGNRGDIDFGICGYTYLAPSDSTPNGGWSLVKATLGKRTPRVGSTNTEQEWVVYLEMVDQIHAGRYTQSSEEMTFNNSNIGMYHAGVYSTEESAPFVVTKEINTFPIAAFLDSIA